MSEETFTTVSEDQPQPNITPLIEIARGWQVADRLAATAAVVIGSEAAQALLETVRRPLRRAARHELSHFRLSLLECEPSNPTGKGESDELTRPADTNCN